jgi:hypothetical protein
MAYGTTVPSRKLWERLCVDDNLSIGAAPRKPKGESVDEVRSRVCEIRASMDRADSETQLPVSEDNRTNSLGAEVDG